MTTFHFISELLKLAFFLTFRYKKIVLLYSKNAKFLLFITQVMPLQIRINLKMPAGFHSFLF